MKLEGLRLLVEDFDTSFIFYSQVLGFEIKWGKLGDVYASFDTGGHIGLSIFKSNLMYEALEISMDQNMQKNNPSVIVIACDDVDLIYHQLKSKEVKFLTKPKDMPHWGKRCMHIRDPEGNLIEFSSELAKEKWHKDLLEDAKNYNTSTV